MILGVRGCVHLFVQEFKNQRTLFQSLQSELESHQNEITSLEEEIQQLDAKYHSPESGALVKDSTQLHKKYDTTLQKAAKVRKQMTLLC